MIYNEYNHYIIITMDRELSDLKLERRECEKCGAQWINGQHVWSTGNRGSEEDLAGLVCNKLGNEKCINPKRGSEAGDTWAARLTDIESGFDAKKLQLEQQRERFKSEFGEDPHFDD